MAQASPAAKFAGNVRFTKHLAEFSSRILCVPLAVHFYCYILFWEIGGFVGRMELRELCGQMACHPHLSAPIHNQLLQRTFYSTIKINKFLFRCVCRVCQCTGVISCARHQLMSGNFFRANRCIMTSS